MARRKPPKPRKLAYPRISERARHKARVQYVPPRAATCFVSLPLHLFRVFHLQPLGQRSLGRNTKPAMGVILMNPKYYKTYLEER